MCSIALSWSSGDVIRFAEHRVITHAFDCVILDLLYIFNAALFVQIDCMGTKEGAIGDSAIDSAKWSKRVPLERVLNVDREREKRVL